MIWTYRIGALAWEKEAFRFARKGEWEAAVCALGHADAMWSKWHTDGPYR